MNQYDEFEVNQKADRDWETSKDIRLEFNGDKESYKAFRRAEAQGVVTIHKSKVASQSEVN